MTAPVFEPEKLRRERARLRKAGVVILLTGLAGAGLLYAIRSKPEDPNLTDYLQSQVRAESRQMGLMYGKSGQMLQDLATDLEKPGTQACIIAGISIVVALGCFYLAQEPEENHGVEDKSLGN